MPGRTQAHARIFQILFRFSKAQDTDKNIEGRTNSATAAGIPSISWPLRGGILQQYHTNQNRRCTPRIMHSPIFTRHIGFHYNLIMVYWYAMFPRNSTIALKICTSTSYNLIIDCCYIYCLRICTHTSVRASDYIILSIICIQTFKNIFWSSRCVHL